MVAYIVGLPDVCKVSRVRFITAKNLKFSIQATISTNKLRLFSLSAVVIDDVRKAMKIFKIFLRFNLFCIGNILQRIVWRFM